MARPTTIAQRLRREPTEAEKRLWWALREAGLPWKFRRQHPIQGRIADFACVARKLVIELDGGQHSPEVDATRTAEIEKRGFRIIRFWNNEVLENTDGVLEVIRRELEEGPTSPRPSPPRRGGEGVAIEISDPSAAPSEKSFSTLEGGEGFRMRWGEGAEAPEHLSSGNHPPHPTLSPLKGGEGSVSAVAVSDFARLMSPLGPFERGPRLAIAVSGGADSLALALLADRWARDLGGGILALTVDHGLRPEAAAEARQVASWLAARDIRHRTLRWDGPHPAKGRQAAARSARYRLLEAACAEAGILHLLLAHHLEDQAETFLLRLARGSGLDGLAGMAAIAEHRDCRLLRPLLTIPRARLAATLEALGQPWIEDPSNRDPAYARVRLRRSAALLATEGLTPRRLAETASRLARSRAAVEEAAARCLVRSAMIHPAGFAWVEAKALTTGSGEVGLRALAALLATVGGEDYTPRLDRLERLYDRLSAGNLGAGNLGAGNLGAGDFGAGATLGGCRILSRKGRVLLCREPAALAAPLPIVPGTTTLWDGRFALEAPESLPSGLTLGALGQDAPALAKACGKAADAIPSAVRPSLPAIRDLEGVVLVPHLPYARNGFGEGLCGPGGLKISFRPTRPLSTAGFTVV